ncbi:MAG: hypothetical protein ABW061_18835 [Polyangiaceae bacterium]
MLTSTGPALWLTAFGAARADRRSDLLATAGSALDQTLAQLPIAREVPMLIFSGAWFAGPREEQPWNSSQGPLLDNNYAARVVGELLLARGMQSVQAHGVLLAEDAPLLKAVQVARSFLRAEGHDRLVIVAIEPPAAAASALVLARGDAGIGLLAMSHVAASTSQVPRRDLVDRVEALRHFEFHADEQDALTLVEGDWLARFGVAGSRSAACRERDVS